MRRFAFVLCALGAVGASAVVWPACKKGRAPGRQVDARPSPARESRPRVRARDVDAGREPALLERVLAEVKEAENLPSQVDRREFLAKALDRLGRWVDTLIEYSQSGRRADADTLARAVRRLVVEAWGPGRFPPDKYEAFQRDRFEVRGHVVAAAEYFRPLVLTAADGSRVVRSYRFSVYVRAPGQRIHYRIGRRYYLEEVRPKGGGETFFRIVMETGGKATVAARLGPNRPSYWDVRRRIRALVEGAKAKGEL